MCWHRNSTNNAAWVLQKVRRDVGIWRVGASFAARAHKIEQWFWPVGPVEDSADSRRGQLNWHSTATASTTSDFKLIKFLHFVQVGGLGIHYGKRVFVIHHDAALLPLVWQHQRHAVGTLRPQTRNVHGVWVMMGCWLGAKFMLRLSCGITDTMSSTPCSALCFPPPLAHHTMLPLCCHTSTHRCTPEHIASLKVDTWLLAGAPTSDFNYCTAGFLAQHAAQQDTTSWRDHLANWSNHPTQTHVVN